MKKVRLGMVGILGLASLLAFTGCGDDDGGCTEGTEGCACDSGSCELGLACQEDQCVAAVAINFSIDDSANQTYVAGELEWKGSFSYDAASRMIAYDETWAGGTGPYPTLYDDGPWTEGGHEPAGATAGDHVWSVTVFFPVPEADVTFEYGAQTSDGGWIWGPNNGSFVVPAGATGPITAPGMTVEAFGDIDLMVTIDASALGGTFTYTPGDTVVFKTSVGAWASMPCLDTGQSGDATASDLVFTFVLSEHVGPGTDFPHTGLLSSGDQPQFVFEIAGVEYKGDIGGGTQGALTDGVTAYTMAPGGSWQEQSIFHMGVDNNAAITVP